MSDSPENTTGETNAFDIVHTGPICQVAYTLNNMQPVACTIIGDQPMFYMDYETEHEEESFLEDHEIAILEKEVSKLQKEIEEFERFSGIFDDGEEKKIYDIFENASDITSQDKAAYNEVAGASLKQNIVQTLMQSRLAKAYLDHATQYNVQLVLSAQVEFAAYDRKSGEILINPNQDFETMVLLAARELRRHWQHRNGALINPLLFHPDNAILINRLQQADLCTSIVRVAWELQLTGHKDIWERLEKSPMADLARAFAHEAFLDFRTINNGVASAAVLEAWFLSERCKNEDKELIQQMLNDAHGYVFENGEPMKSVTADLIAALGTMPFGKNYLAMHAMTIMDESIFTDVRDRSNANFLWFIKFERSFRESEQGLQNGESSHGQNGQTSKTKPGMNHAKSQNATQNATIVQFKARQDNAGKHTSQGVLSSDTKKCTKNASSKTKATDAGKVVYLQKWSAE
ncbi:MAG: hypothetical protein CMH27_07100 [Micavibrio sp.]|nr:hypothetical protein [Micavibrio sp.]|tara:strand:- start:386 stop:1768 length:1383 start_codon:yes stop_codon:yes gene_type:complete